MAASGRLSGHDSPTSLGDAGPAPTVHRITVEGSSVPIDCPAGETILRAMEHLNLSCIPVGCRGGGCGVCRIRVKQGVFTARRMSRAHVSEADQTSGIGLACCLMPQGDLEIEVLGPAHPVAGPRSLKAQG